LLLSSSKPFGRKIRWKVMQIIRGAGFASHDGKTRRYDLRRHEPFICGVRVTREGRLYLSTRYLRKLEGLLHRALVHGDVPFDLAHGHMGEVRLVQSSGASRAPTRQEVRVNELYQTLSTRAAVERTLLRQYGEGPSDPWTYGEEAEEELLW
jgi:hypothetical protein